MKIRSIAWHGIDPDSGSGYQDGTNPPESMFRGQIRFILDNYTPISIFDFISIIKDKKPAHSYIKPPILLGFDDGLRSVITCALPVLQEFNIPAVFFIPGEVLRNPDFVPWFAEVRHLLRRTNQKMIYFLDRTIVLQSCGQRKTFKSLFGRYFKTCNTDEQRQSLLTELARLLDVNRPSASDLDEDLRFIGKDDLSVLNSSNLLTVASHGMTHRNLGSLTYEEQLHELEESDAELRNRCPSYYPIISYPDGSLNPDTIAIASRIYKFGFAVFLGASYQNYYAYPRHLMGVAHGDELKYALSSIRMHYLLPLRKLLYRKTEAFT